MSVKTITEVLDELNSIVNTAEIENSRAGYFAYVYYRTTLQIKIAIDEKQFENNERMEAFDVIFANLYLEAYAKYLEGKNIPHVWQNTFQADQYDLSIIQHIMLGMNAHINLDLGVAAAEVMKGKNIHLLESDFLKVNDILASLVNELQMRLARVSPFFFLIDWISGKKDDQIINFSMKKARQFAWQLALDLSERDEDDDQIRLKSADTMATRLSQTLIQPPGKLLPFALDLVRRFESNTASEVIQKLSFNKLNHVNSLT